MKICALPHIRWNPVPRPRKPSLAEIFGEASGGDTLNLPLHWRDPYHVFVATALDLFAQDDAFVHAVFDVMARAVHHEFQVETARSDRLRQLGPQLAWRPNIWMGVSVASQDDLARVDDLLRSGARVRFAHLVGPVAVGQSDLVGIDFVMVEGANADQHPGLHGACTAAGCRLFMGSSETADEQVLPASTTHALWMPRRGGRR